MLNSIIATPLDLASLVLVLLASLVFGVLLTFVFSYRGRLSSSFSLALLILPVAMSMITVMINGNLGVAVAVAGGFTLVRFRSIAGTGKEIAAIFSAMTLGVCCGMGYVGMAVVFFVVLAICVFAYVSLFSLINGHEKLLKITIPEDYDYQGLFDEVFKKYGISAVIEKVKTTNMGSLIDVTYRIRLSNNCFDKEILDDIRTLNGNLSIVVSNYEEGRESL